MIVYVVNYCMLLVQETCVIYGSLCHSVPTIPINSAFKTPCHGPAWELDSRLTILIPNVWSVLLESSSHKVVETLLCSYANHGAGISSFMTGWFFVPAHVGKYFIHGAYGYTASSLRWCLQTGKVKELWDMHMHSICHSRLKIAINWYPPVIRRGCLGNPPFVDNLPIKIRYNLWHS